MDLRLINQFGPHQCYSWNREVTWSQPCVWNLVIESVTENNVFLWQVRFPLITLTPTQKRTHCVWVLLCVRHNISPRLDGSQLPRVFDVISFRSVYKWLYVTVRWPWERSTVAICDTYSNAIGMRSASCVHQVTFTPCMRSTIEQIKGLKCGIFLSRIIASCSLQTCLVSFNFYKLYFQVESSIVPNPFIWCMQQSIRCVNRTSTCSSSREWYTLQVKTSVVNVRGSPAMGWVSSVRHFCSVL
jgi:hypothetical protein